VKITPPPSAELSRLFAQYPDTDKVTLHSYDRVYNELFGSRRHTVKHLLEIGVWKGDSLRVWADWFVNAKIVGLDCEPVIVHHPRIDVWIGDVFWTEWLKGIVDVYSSFDVIIDDGPHTENAQLAAWNVLFPHLSPGGVYVIEDVQSLEVAHRIADSRGGKIIDLQALKGRFDDILIVWERGANI
jgi:hypothetical protein